MATAGRIAFVLASVVAATELGALSRPVQNRPLIYQDLEPGAIVTLHLDAMASLPSGAVFLGGSYRTASGPVHSSLLVSRDAGKTWVDQDLQFPGSKIGRFETYGSSLVWALVLFNTEGVEDPEHLLISRDAGTSWDRVALSAIRMPSIRRVDQFRFLDARHGILTIKNSLGQGTLLQTSNGGRSWNPVWSIAFDPDAEQFEYPVPSIPLHASVWAPPRDSYYKAIGLIRVVDDPNDSYAPFSVQSGAGSDWKTIARIPRSYVLEGGRLRPTPPPR